MSFFIHSFFRFFVSLSTSCFFVNLLLSAFYWFTFDSPYSSSILQQFYFTFESIESIEMLEFIHSGVIS